MNLWQTTIDNTYILYEMEIDFDKKAVLSRQSQLILHVQMPRITLKITYIFFVGAKEPEDSFNKKFLKFLMAIKNPINEALVHFSEHLMARKQR